MTKTEQYCYDQGRGELKSAMNQLKECQKENKEIQALFDLQHTRMKEATRLWQDATGKHDILPDLGDLLTWLLDEIDRLEKGKDEDSKKIAKYIVTLEQRTKEDCKARLEDKAEILPKDERWAGRSLSLDNALQAIDSVGKK